MTVTPAAVVVLEDAAAVAIIVIALEDATAGAIVVLEDAAPGAVIIVTLATTGVLVIVLDNAAAGAIIVTLATTGVLVIVLEDAAARAVIVTLATTGVLVIILEDAAPRAVIIVTLATTGVLVIVLERVQVVLGFLLFIVGIIFGFLCLDGRECIRVTRMDLMSRLHLFFFCVFFWFCLHGPCRPCTIAHGLHMTHSHTSSLSGSFAADKGVSEFRHSIL